MIQDRQNNIRQFEDHEGYDVFSGSTDFECPNVSHCVEEEHVHYTPCHCEPRIGEIRVMSTTAPTKIPGSATSFSFTVNYMVVDVAEDCSEVRTSKSKTYTINVEVNKTTEEKPISGTVDLSGTTVEWNTIQEVYYGNVPLTLRALTDGTKIRKTGHSGTFYYSLDDGETWESATSATVISLNTGEFVQFKGNLTPTSSNGVGRFSSSTGEFEAGGNPMSLIFGDDFIGKHDITDKGYSFAHMFEGCTNNLININNMYFAAEKLSVHCYDSMFMNCQQLTDLSMVSIGNYENRKNFNDHSNEYAYYRMFRGCTKLTKTPMMCWNSQMGYNDYLCRYAERMCSEMYYGCSSLREVTLFTSGVELDKSPCGTDAYQLQNWMYGVPETGGIWRLPKSWTKYGNFFYTMDYKENGQYRYASANSKPHGWPIVYVSGY